MYTPTIHMDSRDSTGGFNMRHFAETGATTTAVATAKPVVKKGWLPKWVVIPVFVLSSIWKLMVIFEFGLPVQLFFWVYSLISYLWDGMWYLIFGYWCRPCGYVFVWLWNGPTFPIFFLGWLWRLTIGVFGFMVDGWMLIFGGSGCFMRWGYDCWNKRLSERKYWEVGQLAFWTRDTTPSIKDQFASKDENGTCPYTNRFEAFKAGVSDFMANFAL